MPFFLDILVRGDGIVHVFLSPIILIGPRVGNYPHFFIFWEVIQGGKIKKPLASSCWRRPEAMAKRFTARRKAGRISASSCRRATTCAVWFCPGRHPLPQIRPGPDRRALPPLSGGSGRFAAQRSE